MLPLHIVLVRHGQSEGNVAIAHSKDGDDSDFTPEFMNRHSTSLRLTEKGKQQVEATARWLRESGLTKFDRYYVSEYIRAVETAVHLGLPGASWRIDSQLRELDHGLVDILPDAEKKKQYGEVLRLRSAQLFFGRWPAGESIADVCDRLRNNIVSTLHRECEGKRVIIVSHGDIMRCFRVIFERISAHEYHLLDQRDPREFKIGNGQVIHYTRENPEKPGDVRPYLTWVRSVNPYDPAYAGHGWKEIIRKKYSNEELQRLTSEFPRMIAG